MPGDRDGLPREFADRFTRPLRRFLKIESAAGVLLLVATTVALLISNSSLAGSASGFWETSAGFHFGGLDFTRSVRHWVNDALMTLFFFVVALELKRELVSGSLRSAAFPLAGALGGMVVPPAIYVALLHGTPAAHGWGTAREWVSGLRLQEILERVVAHPTAAHRRGVGERDELRTAEIAAKEAVSPVERIELRLHPWSAFLIMPVFALANAGVQLSWAKLTHPVSLAVVAALMIGKPVGVITLCWLAERVGILSASGSCGLIGLLLLLLMTRRRGGTPDADGVRGGSTRSTLWQP